MLHRLRIRGFKSLHDVDAKLAPVVVLFGPNAVGKSNFLEAVLLLSRLVGERTVAEAFGPPLRGYPMEAFSLPAGGLPQLLSQSSASLRLDATVTGAESPLRYAVEVEATPGTGRLAVTDEYLARLKRDGEPKGPPRIEKAGDHLVVRRYNEAGHPRQEPLGLNHTQASNLQFSGETRYPDFDRLRQEVGAWRSYYLDPATAMRSAQPPRDVLDIGSAGEHIAPFLYRIQGDEAQRKHFLAVQRALRAAIPSIEALGVGLDKERGTLEIRIRQHGTDYSSRVISEGTMRILALCAIAANPWPSSLVAFEEPENGVHPRRIEVIADILSSIGRRTQLLLTTHSPTLVAAMLQRQRQDQNHVLLLRCVQEDAGTHLIPFVDPGALFEDEPIQQALRGSEDELIMTDMLIRGWLDG